MRSSAVMAAGTLVSRILGFVKTLLITVAVGVGTITDIFELSNQLPNQIYVLTAAGVFNAVLVPQVIKAAKNPDGGADYISRLVSLAVIAVLGITIAVVALATPIISTMGNGWTPEQTDLGVTFALWCFPQIFFYGLYAVLGQILNAKEAFGWYMWAPALNNLIAIAALIVFIMAFGTSADTARDLNTWGPSHTFLLAGMATIGVACQALVLFIPLRSLKLGLRMKFGWRGIGLGKSIRLSGWVLLTGVVANLSFLYLTWIAAIPTGHREQFAREGIYIPGIAALNYSAMIYQLPHGVIGLSIATVLFNRMSNSAARNDSQGVAASLSRGLRVSGVATVFCATAFIVFAGPIGMMFSGGNAAAGAQIGQTLTILALGGPFLTIAFFMGRAFYAREDARTPLTVQVIAAAGVVILGLLVMRMNPAYIVFAVAGLYVLQNVLTTYLYHRRLVQWVGDYDLHRIIGTHLRVIAASLVAGALGCVILYLMGGWSVDGFAWHNQITALISVATGGTAMAAAYLLALKVFGVRELDSLLAPLIARLGR